MPRSQDESARRRRAAGEEDAIAERLIDDQDRSPDAIEAAARAAFEEDQRTDPDHPTRTRRELAAERGIEDPAHSRGTESGTPSAASPPSGGSVHANRDRSDLKGSPARPAEQTGETGSGRSAANPPAAGRNTRSKESDA